MFGAIKKMFKRGGSGSKESPETTQAVAEQNPSENESYAAQPAGHTAAEGGGSGESLRISLKALVGQLPKELQGKNSPGPNEALVLPKEEVLEQLAQGAVKVPFGQVRRVASTGVLAGGSSHDNRMVDVPLREILTQLGLEYFARRQDQRVIHVPDEIQDIFGGKGEARAQMRILQKDELKPAAKGDTDRQTQQTQAPVYQTPTAASFGAQPLPQQERITIGGARPAAAQPASMQPIQRNEFLIFNLAEISANWPDAVKREIQRLNAKNSKCVLPTAEIQEALKQGRVSYTWRQISGRLQPALAPNSQLTNDQAPLDLPIAVVASAFFTQTQQASTANRQVVKPPADIEPVFRGGPAAPKAAPSPPKAAPPPPRPIQPPPQPQGQTQIRMKQEPPLAPPPASVSAPAMQQPRPAAPPPRPQAAPTGGSKGNVVFKVSDVWGNWPVEIKNHANGLKLSSAQVAIPFEMVEPGLRSGKIEFSWADFCYWIQNCPAGAELPPDTRVALPLPVMAPLCLRLSPPTQRRAENLEHIPDIFGPSGQKADDEEEEEDAPVFQKAPAPAQRPAPTPTRAPTPPPQPTYTPAAPAPVPLPATASGPDPGLAAKNLADLFGEPGKRNWTPNEIVQRTSQLPGVSGALIALQDGLLVANCMPQGWKTETIAAFLPQIFGRMSQYVKELSMGDLISVTVAVEQGTLQVYKAGIIYFAALARPDGSLPLAALNLIARELSRHTK